MAPRTHYQIALGENNGRHSWIIHSAKGIKWRNIPDELVTLLQNLGVDELLDFDLGSDGRWYVRYHQTGPETYETSPYLWMEFGQGSNVELERVTLGPGDSHWGVYRAADGSFQPFSSVTNRFSRLMDPETDDNEFNSQIDFVSLGYGACWAIGVNGRVEHRCGKPFRNKLTDGQKARKRVSTIVLSPMASVWIIVWEDGIFSHNLPPSIATEVEDYCQLRHSLKARHRRYNRPETISAHTQPPTTNPPQTASQRPTQSNVANNSQLSLTQPTINNSPNLTSVSTVTLPPRPPVLPTVIVLPQRQPPVTVPPTITQQPVPRPAPTWLPTSPIHVPKAPFLAKPGHTQNNAWSMVQPSWTHQTINSRLNAESVPAPTFPPLPPVPQTADATPVPDAQIAMKSTPTQRPVTKQAATQTPVQVPKAAYVKPVQATQSTTLATSQVPLTWKNMSPLSGASSQLGRTYSRVEAGLRKPYFYVPPRKLSTTLRLLDPSDWPDLVDYKKIARLFETGWKHQRKQLPKIKRIFAVSLPDHLNESYDEYKDLLETRNGRNGVNEQLVFHGTTWCCSLGEEERDITSCEKMTCSLCCILRTSFLISKVGSTGRGLNSTFGSGIYTSSASSRADDYATAPWLPDYKAVIVAKVALGKSSIHYRTSEHLTAPPWGYDSVIGEVGIDLNYDEQVVYRNEAIRPAYIVIYERPTNPPVTTIPRPAPKATRSNMTIKTKSSTSSRCTIM